MAAMARCRRRPRRALGVGAEPQQRLGGGLLAAESRHQERGAAPEILYVRHFAVGHQLLDGGDVAGGGAACRPAYILSSRSLGGVCAMRAAGVAVSSASAAAIGNSAKTANHGRLR